jgi:nitrate/TMAO reductase-like tetraheme cytochrome c subunit
LDRDDATVRFGAGAGSSVGILQRILSRKIGLLGFYLSLASIFLFIVAYVVYHYTSDVRVGVVTFMAIPGLLLLGITLTLLSVWLPHHGDSSTLLGSLGIPPSPSAWRPVFLRGFLTLVGVGLASFMIYQGYFYSDSVEFCGILCHRVMLPEYTAYQGSAHSKLPCTTCHIGSGASWFVRAKLGGLRQVLATILNTYEKPIPTPVHDLRPARETCEECHLPEKFHGDVIRVVRGYQDDEANSPISTVLVLKTGGQRHGLEEGEDIHWHVTRTVEYRADDESRQEISLVRYTDNDGKQHTYRADDDHDADVGSLRQMDCIDCHNRPTHVFELADKAVDRLISEGRIDRTIPYIRSVGISALEQEASTQEEGLGKVADYVGEYYDENYPDDAAGLRPSLDTAVEGLKSAYARNVFPAMNVTWGTYINNIGHEPWPGCFRCHGSDLEDEDGEGISGDCITCHAILAFEEEGELDIYGLFDQ